MLVSICRLLWSVSGGCFITSKEPLTWLSPTCHIQATAFLWPVYATSFMAYIYLIGSQSFCPSIHLAAIDTGALNWADKLVFKARTTWGKSLINISATKIPRLEYMKLSVVNNHHTTWQVLCQRLWVVQSICCNHLIQHSQSSVWESSCHTS